MSVNHGEPISHAKAEVKEKKYLCSFFNAWILVQFLNSENLATRLKNGTT